MTSTHLIAFNMALLAAIASPGPAFLVAVHTTVTDGTRSGIIVGLGLGLKAAMWTLLALLGLESIFLLMPWVYMTAKICGALFLCYIAFLTWRHATSPSHYNANRQRSAFRNGVLINLLNPKSVLFAAAVLVVIFPADLTAWEIGVIVTNHLAIEIIFYTALAYVMGSEAIRNTYLQAKKYLDRGASVILLSLGLSMLFQKND
jgi:threonine/homoserine/homoserine lactone efflux protein